MFLSMSSLTFPEELLFQHSMPLVENAFKRQFIKTAKSVTIGLFITLYGALVLKLWLKPLQNSCVKSSQNSSPYMLFNEWEAKVAVQSKESDVLCSSRQQDTLRNVSLPVMGKAKLVIVRYKQRCCVSRGVVCDVRRITCSTRLLFTSSTISCRIWGRVEVS